MVEPYGPRLNGWSSRRKIVCLPFVKRVDGRTNHEK